LLNRRSVPISSDVIHEFRGRNDPARRLYQRLGFEIVNEEEIQFHMSLAPRASAETQAE
jgi:ribosomal protein S18 acetylase RimI-like enzyme